MSADIEISIVIPVYNAGKSLERVVHEIRTIFEDAQFEIVLVNDGSHDDSEQVCRALANESPANTAFLQLARNFGEHHAVLAGLSRTRGRHVGILDDDGQNPPEELHRMWRLIQESGDDVLYGRYREKQHNWFRNIGSRAHNALATWLLGKPSSLYLSSFKVMTEGLARELVAQGGTFPYLDGVIVRSTDRVGQVEVSHRERVAGHSGYTLRKLVRLSMAMGFGYSLWPLRMAFILGVFVCLLGIVLLAGTAVNRLWLQPGVAWGTEALGLSILCFSGIQLISLGILGEYVGRMWLRQSGAPAYVIRYACDGRATDA